MKTFEEIKTAVFNILQPNQKVYLADMVAIIGVPSRAIRRAISSIAQEYPIISLASDKGYMRIDATNPDAVELASHQIGDFISRINILNSRIKALSNFVEDISND